MRRRPELQEGFQDRRVEPQALDRQCRERGALAVARAEEIGLALGKARQRPGGARRVGHGGAAGEVVAREALDQVGQQRAFARLVPAEEMGAAGDVEQQAGIAAEAAGAAGFRCLPRRWRRPADRSPPRACSGRTSWRWLSIRRRSACGSPAVVMQVGHEGARIGQPHVGAQAGGAGMRVDRDQARAAVEPDDGGGGPSRPVCAASDSAQLAPADPWKAWGTTARQCVSSFHSTSQDGISATDGAPKRLRLSSMRQRAAPISLRPGVECDGAEAMRQRVVHTLCGGAGWERSSRAGTPLFSAASDRRRPAVGSAARVSPSTAAMPGQRRPSSIAQNRSSSRSRRDHQQARRIEPGGERRRHRAVHRTRPTGGGTTAGCLDRSGPADGRQSPAPRHRGRRRGRRGRTRLDLVQGAGQQPAFGQQGVDGRQAERHGGLACPLGAVGALQPADLARADPPRSGAAASLAGRGAKRLGK